MRSDQHWKLLKARYFPRGKNNLRNTIPSAPIQPELSLSPGKQKRGETGQWSVGLPIVLGAPGSPNQSLTRSAEVTDTAEDSVVLLLSLSWKGPAILPVGPLGCEQPMSLQWGHPAVLPYKVGTTIQAGERERE